MIFFSYENEVGLFLLTPEIVGEALHNISEYIQKLLEMRKTRTPIKAFKWRPAVCCNFPLQPNSPVPQWIILKRILDRRCNGQNEGISDFPECLWLLHKNCYPFSYTLVFTDLLITAENLNIPDIHPCRDCLVKEKNHENTLKHLIGIEVELVK